MEAGAGKMALKLPTTELRIRIAGGAEAGILADLIAAAFSSYAGDLDPPSSALRETLETIAGHLADGQAALAETAGVPIGCVLFKAVSPAEVYLGRLAVLPAWRGHGVARALIGFVEERARGQQARILSLGVRIALPGNQRLFAACGFREVSRSAHPGFSEPTSIRMEKALDQA